MLNFVQFDNIECYTGNIWHKRNSVQLRKWIGPALQKFLCYCPYGKCFSVVCLPTGRTEWNQGFQCTHCVLAEDKSIQSNSGVQDLENIVNIPFHKEPCNQTYNNFLK